MSTRRLGMKRGINIYNEIKPLKKVILYRPNNELLNLIPSNMNDYGFKSLPDLIQIQKEHDLFANILRHEGVDVIYLIDLIIETLSVNNNIKEKFIKQFIKEAGIKLDFINNEIYNLLSKIDSIRKLVNKCIEGIRCNEINSSNIGFFKNSNDNNLVVEPLANMFNIHEQIAFVGDGVIFTSNKKSKMHRETIFLEYIFKYHPKYKNYKIYNERYNNNLISASDFLILNNEVVCIGMNFKTEAVAISNLAIKILNEKIFKYIIVLDLKKINQNISLKSLISMVNYNQFVIHNDIINVTDIYELSLHNDKLTINTLHMSLDKVLEKYLHLNKVNFIKCGNGDYFASKKEEYYNASSVLCISPKFVLAYGINRVTNEQLRANGLKVIEFNNSEFIKSNGGINNILIFLMREN